jgi:phosphopantothenoylcysteine decarboxylase/phosphopantothenate--cysteine ligase
VVGWKFELDGDREQALETARKQIADNATALSILNGAAFGEGFGILDPQGACQIAQTRSELCQRLVEWANRLLPA